MTKKKEPPDSKRKKRPFGVKLKWCANHLSEEKLKHADELSPTPTQIMEFLLQAVDAGIDIKLGFDDYSSCYQATAVGAYDGFSSAGYAVSARSARDVYDTLVLIWYKVVILADGDLSALMTDKEVDDLRG